MRQKLTRKEEKVWGIINSLDTPTLFEILEKYGYKGKKKTGVALMAYYTEQLKKKGWIRKVGGNRNIRIKYEKV